MNMHLPILFLLIGMFHSSLSLAHTEAESIHCDHVNGLQILNDFTMDGKPFVSKTLTDLYTTKSDDGFMTHIAVSESKFKEGNIEIIIEALNSRKKVIKKFLLNSWSTDKSFPDKKISMTNVLKVLTSKITEPYDTFANLSEDRKSKIDPLKVPHDARISIQVENKSPFCTFIFKYGSVSSY